MPPQQRPPLSDALREAISESLKAGETFAGLERQTGVLRQSLMRFVRGEQSLLLDKADLLADHLGLELRSVRTSKRKGK